MSDLGVLAPPTQLGLLRDWSRYGRRGQDWSEGKMNLAGPISTRVQAGCLLALLGVEIAIVWLEHLLHPSAKYMGIVLTHPANNPDDPEYWPKVLALLEAVRDDPDPLLSIEYLLEAGRTWLERDLRECDDGEALAGVYLLVHETVDLALRALLDRFQRTTTDDPSTPAESHARNILRRLDLANSS